MAGTLRLNHGQALQNSTVNLAAGDSGTLDLNGLNATLGGLAGRRDQTVPDGRILSVGQNQASLTYEGRLSGKSITLRKVGSRSWTLTGDHRFTGITDIQGGSLILGNGDSTGWLNTPIQNQAALLFHHSDARVFDQPISGSGSLTKLGRGALTFTAVNNYSGPTYIRDGTLWILGRHLGGGLYEVGGGIAATTPVLGGTGFLEGTVKVWQDGVLAPGLSLGTLTIQGDVLLGGTLRIELDGTGPGASDLLQVEGMLDLSDGSLRLASLSELDDEAYVFVSYGLLKGERFGRVLNLPDNYYLDYHYLGLNQIALVVVPEPPTVKLLVFALFAFLVATRRRG